MSLIPQNILYGNRWHIWENKFHITDLGSIGYAVSIGTYWQLYADSWTSMPINCNKNTSHFICIVICCIVKTLIHLYFTAAFSLSVFHFYACFLTGATHNSPAGCESGLCPKDVTAGRLLCQEGAGGANQANPTWWFVNSEGWLGWIYRPQSSAQHRPERWSSGNIIHVISPGKDVERKK